MKTNQWTKEEFIAYVLLYAAHSDIKEHNLERNVIISKVDMKTFEKIHKEFDADNDYQNIQKILNGLEQHKYSKTEIDLLIADIKVLFFADDNFDIREQSMLMFLNRIFNLSTKSKT